MKRRINILTQPTKKLSEIDVTILEKINFFPEKVIKMNISELAKFSYTSTATVSRFIRKFSFVNYKEFIIYINKMYEKENTYLEPIKDQEALINDLIEAEKYAIENIISKKDYQKIQKCAYDLKIAQSIAIFSVGLAYAPGQELHSNLWKIHKASFIATDINIFLATISNWKSEDIVVIFSDQIKKRELNYIINYCFVNNIKTILITSNYKLQNNEKIYQVILYNDANQKYYASYLSSQISQLLIADLLFQTIIFNDQTYVPYFKNINSNLNEWNAQN